MTCLYFITIILVLSVVNEITAGPSIVKRQIPTVTETKLTWAYVTEVYPEVCVIPGSGCRRRKSLQLQNSKKLNIEPTGTIAKRSLNLEEFGIAFDSSLEPRLEDQDKSSTAGKSTLNIQEKDDDINGSSIQKKDDDITETSIQKKDDDVTGTSIQKKDDDVTGTSIQEKDSIIHQLSSSRQDDSDQSKPQYQTIKRTAALSDLNEKDQQILLQYYDDIPAFVKLDRNYDILLETLIPITDDGELLGTARFLFPTVTSMVTIRFTETLTSGRASVNLKGCPNKRLEIPFC